MTTHQEKRQGYINDACIHFNTNSLEAKKLLETCCIARLSVSKNEYEKWTRALNATPNHQLILKDKKEYREANFIKSICKKLKISKELLHTKIKNYNYINVSIEQLKYIREIFGFKVNKHEMYLKHRPADIRKREEKIIDMFSKGKKYREISEAIGKPMIDVITKINRLRARSNDPNFLPLRPPGNFSRAKGYTPENIGKLLREGKTVKELAIIFGKKQHSLQCLITRWRHAYPHANIPPLQTTREYRL